MKIGIDASRAFLKNRTGIEEYSYQVIKHLRDKLDGHEVVLYVRKTQNAKRKTQSHSAKFKVKKSGSLEIDRFELPSRWKIRTIDWPRFWTQGGLAWEMFRRPVDVLFVPAHTVPFIHPARSAFVHRFMRKILGCLFLDKSNNFQKIGDAGGPKKTIVTIHGLEYEITPEAYSFWERLYMRASIKASCRWAKKIIAVSKNTKEDLIRLYDIPREKIEVVYEGKPEAPCLPAGRQSEKCKAQNFSLKLKIEKPYLFFVGRLEKRKNVEGIIEAYKILKEKYDIPHSLVLAGAPGFGYGIIKLKIKNCLKIKNLKLKIIELGYIEESLKQELLSGADAFLFPSFYEGFGLPILEAQSLEVPIVTSNVSSLPEVAGKGAFYCDPLEPESIAQAIWAAIGEKTLRNDIIEKGLENAKRFSWEKCSEEIATLLG